MVRLFLAIALLMLLAPSETANIDAGTLQLFGSGASGSVSLTVTFSFPFGTSPAFAILLSEFSVRNYPTSTGYVHTYGAITPTNAPFSVTIVNTNTLNDVSVRWVATADPILQLFPITVTLDITGAKLYDVQTTFQGASQFGASVMEVVVASVISSFSLTTDAFDFNVNTGVAHWDGTNFVRTTSTLTVMQKTDFFSTNSPFQNIGGTYYVKMHATGRLNTIIYATLLFHVVASHTAASRIETPSTFATPYTYTDNLVNPYNANGVSVTAVRVYGIEAWYFRTQGVYSDNRMRITTIDGITATSYRRTDSSPGTATMRDFYASYGCAAGCICDSSIVCVRCQPYRVMTTDSSGVMHCDTCLPGFYLTATGVCEQCPMNLNCETCAIATGATTPTCTSCNCAQQRQLVGNQCVCISPAYIEAIPPVAYCVNA